ncbi:MAG TPA: branched-chain amino acid ABC transporter substrate-binding protein [Cycloclasticus sp.]|jgi:ABC transporter substrate binding protein (PQQ-dependent alcohol dehydrogenase system)|nr:branched-chain amino acid ABC transporter substrate-binding protein [Cycloclasticus sp.]HIL91273.1 branched-chain amino acid ABC transporter substrate-binding protein [Cycloclasticus sp.]
MIKRLRKHVLVSLLVSFSVMAQAGNVNIKLAFLTEKLATPPALSNLDPVLTDEGIQGVVLGIKDNNTTGKFTGHTFHLKHMDVPVGGNVLQSFQKLVADGYEYIITDVQSATLKTLSTSPSAKAALLFNVSASHNVLRNKNCSANTFHLIPSDAMKADALAQFMLKKRWNKWFLVKGTDVDDMRFAKALKRSAKRFGVKIVEEKEWKFDHDARRTAQADIPVFTQGSDYDVLVVADVKGLFGEYLAMNTWLPRPIIGTQGLVPRAWHRTHERWGAVQMQNRFYEQAGRWMNDVDYASWLAVRAVGEAVTRANSVEVADIKSFMLSDEFSLAGFKGVKLTFRHWNQQLRQPVLLATARSIVSVMPHKEFLHPRTYLDTLGYDSPESTCEF